MRREVVITGVGAISALGVGLYPAWEAMVAGRSGLGQVSRVDCRAFRAGLGGEVKEFTARDHVPKSYRKATKVMARDIELAVVAAKFAVEDAGLVTRIHAETGQTQTTYASEVTGCHIGAGLIAAETLELTTALVTAVKDGAFSLREWGTIDDGAGAPAGGMNNLQPLWMLKYLPNMLACHVTILHGAEGASNTITCGESSGLLSLGESRRVIERGSCDVCFSGGAESKLSLLGLLRSQLAGRLADTTGISEAWHAVRPFDPAGTGTLVGEGGGILILEEAEVAAQRRARIYARFIGFGAAQSIAPGLPPMAAPAEQVNRGLVLAIRAALADAKLQPTDIDAVFPQGSGIAALDAAELGALREVFGMRLESIPLCSITPFVGDLAAGHGGFQTGVAAISLREQKLPARLHVGTPAIKGAAAAPSTPAALRHVLVCCSSLAGQNAAAILSRAE